MRRIISFGPQEDRRDRDGFGSTFLLEQGPAFLVVGNNNTRAGIVLGGGYLITDIQMSTAGRLSSRAAFHSRLVAAASSIQLQEWLFASRSTAVVQWGAGREGRGPVVRVGGCRGAREVPPRPTRWLARRGDATGPAADPGPPKTKFTIVSSPRLRYSFQTLPLSLLILALFLSFSSVVPVPLAFLCSRDREIEYAAQSRENSINQFTLDRDCLI